MSDDRAAVEAWRAEYDALTEDFKSSLMEHIAKQEDLFGRYPCDDPDHEEAKHYHLAHQGLVMDFAVFVAYVAYDKDGDQVTCYSTVQDDSRPHYTKLGLIEKCVPFLH